MKGRSWTERTGDGRIELARKNRRGRSREGVKSGGWMAGRTRTRDAQESKRGEMLCMSAGGEGGGGEGEGKRTENKRAKRGGITLQGPWTRRGRGL